MPSTLITLQPFLFAADLAVKLHVDGRRLHADPSFWCAMIDASMPSQLALKMCNARQLHHSRVSGRDTTSTDNEYGSLLSEDGDAGQMVHQYDAQGCTNALVDDSGQPSGPFGYTAYGQIVQQPEEGLLTNMLAFSRHQAYQAVETGLMMLGMGNARGRFYDPVTARFLSDDPIRQAGGVNLQQYAGNDPVNREDAGGHQVAPSTKPESIYNQYLNYPPDGWHGYRASTDPAVAISHANDAPLQLWDKVPPDERSTIYSMFYASRRQSERQAADGPQLRAHTSFEIQHQEDLDTIATLEIKGKLMTQQDLDTLNNAYNRVYGFDWHEVQAAAVNAVIAFTAGTPAETGGSRPGEAEPMAPGETPGYIAKGPAIEASPKATALVDTGTQGATGAAESAGAKFADDARLQGHFNDHGGDFGAKTPAEYQQQADKFLTGSKPNGVLEKVRPNGDVVRYNPATDEFGVVSKSGNIRTYYKPNPAIHGYPTNLDYFNAQ